MFFFFLLNVIKSFLTISICLYKRTQWPTLKELFQPSRIQFSRFHIDTLQDMSQPIYHSADFSWLLLNPLKPLTHDVLDIINFLFPKKLLQMCSKAKLCSQLIFSIFDIKKQFSPKFSVCVYYAQFDLPSSNTAVKRNMFLLFSGGRLYKLQDIV